jgi:hypothetical protein
VLAVAPGPHGGHLVLSAAPNPARGSSEIRFALPSSGRVSLGIFDLQGRLVRSLLSAKADAGNHAVRFDGRSADGDALANGVYFAKLELDGREVVSRLVMLR